MRLEAQFAQWADDHVDVGFVYGLGALVVGRSSVFAAEHGVACIAFEGEEVFLVAKVEGAVLTNLFKFHSLLKLN